MPIFQVKRFHTIAAKSAAISTVESTICGDVTISPPIVFATPVDTIAPTKFKNADMIIAMRGLKERVAIQVAIAFAVSWKPLIKSKASARTITRPIA